MNFIQKLEKRMDKTKSLVCVGLDPVLEKLPERFKETADPFFEFGKWIIDQTHQDVIAYKPNSAFYETNGSDGIRSLKKVCDYLKENYSDIPLIIDAKRGDIGHTNAAYAKFVFDYLQADAVTLHPYLGSEALSEFFKYEDKGLIILARTSNPGAGEFQDLLVSNDNDEQVPLWQRVALEVTTSWQEKTKADLLLVIGATYPDELKKTREMIPQATFLIPGIGKQGGDLEKTLKYGLNKDNKGVIINSSRGIIYAHSPKEAVRELLEKIKKVEV